MIRRRKSKTVKIGSVKIGSGFPISIQSMTKTDTQDIFATARQIKALEKAGCEIVRVAVKNMGDVSALAKIKAKINIPLVADIHFNYRLGLEAVTQGVDALRLNPGNIYRRQEVEALARAARGRKIPIRVGINSGSLRGAKLKQARPKAKAQGGQRLADLMVRSALDYIKMLEKSDFYDIIVSLKASDIATTMCAYRKMASLCDYPFHLGITASGLPQEGAIKSAIGIGTLLLEGIGDTIRVSLTANPEEEVKVGKEILQALGLRSFYPEIVACPTCGRAEVDVVKIAQKLSKKLYGIAASLASNRATEQNTAGAMQPPLKVAIMGCEVNGPGEARDADIGIAGGKRCGILFKRGRMVKKVPEEKMIEVLVKEIKDALV